MADGAVVSLWRYPLKSMMGEELNASEVTEHGLLGDRSLALVDAETAKVVSAKNPKMWPKMFDCRAALTAPPVLRLPRPHGSDENFGSATMSYSRSRIIARAAS